MKARGAGGTKIGGVLFLKGSKRFQVPAHVPPGIVHVGETIFSHLMSEEKPLMMLVVALPNSTLLLNYAHVCC